MIVIAGLLLMLLCRVISVTVHWVDETLVASSESYEEVVFKLPPDYSQDEPWSDRKEIPCASHLVWLRLELKSTNLNILTIGVYGKTSLHAANRFMKLTASSTRVNENISVTNIANDSFVVTAATLAQKPKLLRDDSSLYMGKDSYAEGLVFLRNDIVSNKFELTTTSARALKLATNDSLIIVGRVVGGMKFAKIIAASESFEDGTPLEAIKISASGVLELVRPFHLPFMKEKSVKHHNIT